MIHSTDTVNSAAFTTHIYMAMILITLLTVVMKILQACLICRLNIINI